MRQLDVVGITNNKLHWERRYSCIVSCFIDIILGLVLLLLFYTTNCSISWSRYRLTAITSPWNVCRSCNRVIHRMSYQTGERINRVHMTLKFSEIIDRADRREVYYMTQNVEVLPSESDNTHTVWNTKQSKFWQHRREDYQNTEIIMGKLSSN